MASRNLPTLLATIADELQPEPERFREAERRAKTLIGELREFQGDSRYKVHEYVAHGSHARATAVLGFKDIDYLLVFDPDALKGGTRKTPSPTETVRGLAAILRRLRGGLVAQGTVAVREQHHSVGVKYPNSKLRIDFVPALRTEEKGCFRIPDREANMWIETRPHLLKRHISRAEHENPHVRRVIRVVKGWRKARGKVMRIPSYAVELLLADWARERARFESLIRYFFTRLAEADERRPLVLRGPSDSSPVTVRDPWSNANVTSELTADHRRRLVENARKALETFDEAEELAAAGREAGAMSRLRRLFASKPLEEEEEEE